MDAQNAVKQPKIKKETKNKIRVDFERTPLKERLKAKFGTTFFYQKLVVVIFRLVLLIGISYVILFPFISKIASSFMGMNDFVDPTVRLIAKDFSLDIYKAVFTELGYWEAFANTLEVSIICAILQTFTCCLVAYGFAKFKFRGNKLLFMLVMLTMIVPHPTMRLAMLQNFKDFDVLGIMDLLAKINILPDGFRYGIKLTETFWPLYILSAGAIAFKNGLYIFMLRQFFRGVPDELEESAYVDGSGVFRTFFTIIIPLSVPMMITVFLFAFSWQWTDNFYTELLLPTGRMTLFNDIISDIPLSLRTDYAGQGLFYQAIHNTAGMMVIAPLIIMYLFCQRYLVQGIERSGIVG
ncbi:MAG: carbohydrate ABC transporter permease [Clostridia bacterium]|nr:carbohydrate ABC transporter permease [Clostridia bacterium]